MKLSLRILRAANPAVAISRLTALDYGRPYLLTDVAVDFAGRDLVE